jgi:hypothetical protein
MPETLSIHEVILQLPSTKNYLRLAGYSLIVQSVQMLYLDTKAEGNKHLLMFIVTASI